MEITITLNGKTMTRSISPDTLLIDFVRSEHCLSVKEAVIQVTVDYVQYY